MASPANGRRRPWNAARPRPAPHVAAASEPLAVRATSTRAGSTRPAAAPATSSDESALQRALRLLELRGQESRYALAVAALEGLTCLVGALDEDLRRQLVGSLARAIELRSRARAALEEP